jgi:hypothetical protein
MVRWDWRATDLESSLWRRSLSGTQIAELDGALAALRSGNTGMNLTDVSVDDFPLPALSKRLRDMANNLVSGIGFEVWDGFPVSRYRTQELKALFWGLSLHLGIPVYQSHRGDVLGDVRDLGTDIRGRQGRGYTSNQALNFHCDAADVTGLFFLHNARSGGLNRIASSLAVHEEIAARRPDLLEVLYLPLCWSWQGNQPPGAKPYYEMPVFGEADGEVSCAYVRTNLLMAEANAGAPAMSPQQIEAVELVASVAAESGMYVEAMFQPGTLLFMNNQRIFHMRTQFEDWDDPARKRHLLRVWLSMPNSRRLPDSFAPFFRDTRPGAVRGGYPSAVRRPEFETR